MQTPRMLLPLLAALIVQAVAADQIVLKDGRRIAGRIVERTNERILVEVRPGIQVTYLTSDIAEVILEQEDDIPGAELARSGEQATTRPGKPTENLIAALRRSLKRVGGQDDEEATQFLAEEMSRSAYYIGGSAKLALTRGTTVRVLFDSDPSPDVFFWDWYLKSPQRSLLEPITIEDLLTPNKLFELQFWEIPLTEQLVAGVSADELEIETYQCRWTSKHRRKYATEDEVKTYGQLNSGLRNARDKDKQDRINGAIRRLYGLWTVRKELVESVVIVVVDNKAPGPRGECANVKGRRDVVEIVAIDMWARPWKAKAHGVLNEYLRRGHGNVIICRRIGRGTG